MGRVFCEVGEDLVKMSHTPMIWTDQTSVFWTWPTLSVLQNFHAEGQFLLTKPLGASVQIGFRNVTRHWKQPGLWANAPGFRSWIIWVADRIGYNQSRCRLLCFICNNMSSNALRSTIVLGGRPLAGFFVPKDPTKHCCYFMGLAIDVHWWSLMHTWLYTIIYFKNIDFIWIHDTSRSIYCVSMCISICIL